jgi:hypothetical protein
VLLLKEVVHHYQKLRLQFVVPVPTTTFLLGVFKFPVGPEVQVDPLYSSVAPVLAEPGGSDPPKPSPAVCVPAFPIDLLVL